MPSHPIAAHTVLVISEVVIKAVPATEMLKSTETWVLKVLDKRLVAIDADEQQIHVIARAGATLKGPIARRQGRVVSNALGETIVKLIALADIRRNPTRDILDIPERILPM